MRRGGGCLGGWGCIDLGGLFLTSFVFVRDPDTVLAGSLYVCMVPTDPVVVILVLSLYPTSLPLRTPHVVVVVSWLLIL